jgi:histidinol dehydrogenase
MTAEQDLRLPVLSTRAADFEREFARLRERKAGEDAGIEQTVRSIIAEVRARGDAALLEYTNRFDGYPCATAAELEVPHTRLQHALAAIAPEERSALQRAAQRIGDYHRRQVAASWRYEDAEGTLLGQQVTALDAVGIYVPGGKAAYPSSVLMNAIPARVAGVHTLIMTVPTPGGQLNDRVLAAAALAGVDRVFTLGGAQAIAALAYGTQTIPRVDKIVGPGNVYVAAAKRLVFGQVDIDMIAGPSEVVVVCDGRSDPAWVAMDLFAQAEHDEDAQAILVSLDEAFTERVRQAVTRLLDGLERASIIRTALERQGALINVRDLEEAIALVNRLAPEHLELSIDDPLSVAKRVRHAGAIFLGRHTAEVLGDYCAGPNHVLPTAGTARFSSPLGVYDFQKRTSLVMCSEESASALAHTAAVLARAEGLTAHARSAEYRAKKQ